MRNPILYLLFLFLLPSFSWAQKDSSKINNHLELIEIVKWGNEDTVASPNCSFEILSQAIQKVVIPASIKEPKIFLFTVNITEKGVASLQKVNYFSDELKDSTIDAKFAAELKKKFSKSCHWKAAKRNNKTIKSTIEILVAQIDMEGDWEIMDAEMDVLVPNLKEFDITLIPEPTTINYNEKVYDVAETMPEFKGGIESMNAFIEKNFVKTEDAKRYSIQGRVIIEFIVLKDGSISDVRPILPASRYLGYGLEEEAIRVIRSMPKWTPGKIKGRDVAVKMVLPVVVQ
jgi:protein TonB